MANNSALHKAKDAKKDEFYTQLEDIEKEMVHYRDFFRGKTVFCNCDDPYESNFFKYFAMNFNFLGLKKLMATCYASSPVAGKELGFWADNKSGQISFLEQPNATELNKRYPYKIEITEVSDENGDGRFDISDVEYLLKNRKNALTLLEGDGDFRSEECVALLKEADVVCTNPPFSLFREYVAQLIKYGKKFIIIGNQNAITYKEIFPLIKENQVWLGCGDCIRWFLIPSFYEMKTKTNIHGLQIAEGARSRWFTNIDHSKRHEDLILYKKYNPTDYPKYDNYDAINVDKTADIPCDYLGVMGVPITFLDKYNPEQFDIIGIDRYTVPKEALVGGRVAIQGKPCYARILIKRKEQ